MINLEKVIINNIINRKSLALFICCCSRLSRPELVTILEYLKNQSRIIHKGVPITGIKIRVVEGLIEEVQKYLHFLRKIQQIQQKDHFCTKFGVNITTNSININRSHRKYTKLGKLQVLSGVVKVVCLTIEVFMQVFIGLTEVVLQKVMSKKTTEQRMTRVFL